MKKKPLTETQFDLLNPNALDPNGHFEEEEKNWPAWAVGSGVASLVAFGLIFLNLHFAGQLFKGQSLELAQNMSYFLIAVTIGFGGYCVYASFKAFKNPS
jgi:hypothetical protein